MWICELLFEFLCVWITVLFILFVYLCSFLFCWFVYVEKKNQQQHRTEKVSSCSSEIILIKSGCHQFTIKVKELLKLQRGSCEGQLSDLLSAGVALIKVSMFTGWCNKEGQTALFKTLSSCGPQWYGRFQPICNKSAKIKEEMSQPPLLQTPILSWSFSLAFICRSCEWRSASSDRSCFSNCTRRRKRFWSSFKVLQ